MVFQVILDKFMCFLRIFFCRKKELPHKDNVQSVLTPTTIEPKDKAYKTIEDIAVRLDKMDAKNIAVTGPYGSGKSSVILTLRKDYPQYKYLHLSLATLKAYQQERENLDVDKDNDKNNERLNRLIEYSILQQLIYREKQSLIPNSRIKRIFHIDKWALRRITLATILFLMAFIIVFEPHVFYVEWICNLLSGKWLNIIGDSIAIVYMVCALFLLISYFIQALGNSKLNVLNLKNGEIKLSEASIFNEHLDEILYFFQVTDYNVVIIEDLDRFETSDIFLKLRELNLLLNESKVIERKAERPIVFIYAIKDDMFLDSERSKFFDYITTVIPTINPSNSKDKLKGELEAKGYKDIADFDLKEMGFFINDMRLLKNIANEYQQYRERLSKDLLPQNLLAMIIFKNYYPRTFAELHRCEGKIYKCLRLKPLFIELINKDIKKKIEQARQDNEAILQNQHLKEKELRQIYITEYRRNLSEKPIRFQVDGTWYTPNEIAENETLFVNFIKQETISYEYYYYYDSKTTTSTNINFSTIEKAIDSSFTYQQRLKTLQTNIGQSLRSFSELEFELSELNSLKCSELMQKVNLQECREYSVLKLEPMIELFLLRGYIDENFYDYISYFYENMISQNDWNFVLGVKLNRKVSFDTHLDNVENCVAEIPDYAYKTKAILNIWILHYLSNSGKYDQKMRQVVKTIMRNKSWDFLAQYYNTFKDDADGVFSYLFSQKTNFWEVFIGYTGEYQSILLEIWIRYAEIDKSTANSQKWIAANYPYFSSLLPKVGREYLQNLVNVHKYQFVELNKESEELLDTIVKTNSYEFNQKNILLIANYLLKKEIPTPSLNLTLVYETNNDTFIKNAINHITVCLKNIFSEPASKEESPESIIGLIENESIDEETKKSYLRNQSNSISLSEIEDEKNKEFAVKQFLIAPTWNEIYEYYLLKGNSVTEELMRFIENFIGNLINLPFSSKEIEKELLHCLIATDSLPINVFREILPVFKRWRFGGTDLSKLPHDKMELLLRNSMLKYNEFNTKQLLPFGDKFFAQYLLSQKSEYLKTPSDISYSKELVSILFSSTGLTIKEKSLLIPCVQENHLEDNQDLAEQIVIVLQQEGVDLDYAVLCEILANSKQIEEKIHVINQTILKKDDITEEEIDTFLKTLPEPYCVIAKRGKNPAIPKKDYSMQLVEILDKINYISSFTPEKDIIRIYTKKTK
ncbi:hypothetical protein Prede_2617 [Prevotella dentalis DSM 3688]|uniref:YobI-like P-loop NTPase domain-containing protein n=2 Tax=Prevotella dentalis (strain ATCC 49559 / DSM 3688 / JCM 13448 / NCTC 12043 / ES 2772) TaxID=908937 RepID=L0JG71_PREDD|nr:hypothetical protein [Prevotella dentalis]AGB29848.1 hypothetical protein Prede_2617 [Prevotella dentalis DSM 3688]